jgi:hypothetical protein
MIEIQHQLQIQYDDLKLQTFVKILSLPPKIYGNGCSILNNTRPTHLKEENELKLQGLFLLLSNNKLRCQINGGNQLIVNWMIKIQSESFQWPYEW